MMSYYGYLFHLDKTMSALQSEMFHYSASFYHDTGIIN